MLGVDGNQPAIAGVVQTTIEEKLTIGRSIMQQQMGANPKALKSYCELNQRQQTAKASAGCNQEYSEEKNTCQNCKNCNEHLRQMEQEER